MRQFFLLLPLIAVMVLPSQSQASTGENDSFYSVLQCWNPNGGWQRGGDITLSPEGVSSSPSFSGYTTTGVGEANGTDTLTDSDGNQNSLRHVGWLGVRNQNLPPGSDTQELGCRQEGDLYWMGAERSGKYTDEFQPEGSKEAGVSWKEWLLQRGLGYLTDTERGSEILHDAFFLRQNIRLPMGSRALSVNGKWRSCRAGGAISQFWAQSQVTTTSFDIPMVEESDPKSPNNLNKTWSPINDCDPVNGPRENFTWNPIAPCATALLAQRADCERRFYEDEDGIINIDVNQGGKIGQRRHAALSQRAIVLRAGSICGAPDSKCFDSAPAQREVKRCRIWIDPPPYEKPNGQVVDPPGYWVEDRFLWDSQGWCAQNFPGYQEDPTWKGDGVVDTNSGPRLRVPGRRYTQDGQQRTMFGKGLVQVIDDENPTIDDLIIYSGMIDKSFPGGTYKVSQQGQTGGLFFTVKDSGGGVSRATITRNDLLEEPLGPPRNLSKPMIAFDPPALNQNPQPVVASPGGWLGADVFQYQWQNCTFSADYCQDRGGATSENFFIPNANDVSNQKRVRVLVRAGRKNGSNIIWSQWSLSDISDKFVNDPNGTNNLNWTAARQSAIFGSPRVGQTVGVFIMGAFNKLYSCVSRNTPSLGSALLGNKCVQRAAFPAGPTGATYKLQPGDAGKWLVMSNGVDLAAFVSQYKPQDSKTFRVEGFFPSLASGGGLIMDFASARAGLFTDGRGDQPLAADYGVLPAYSQRKDLCKSSRASGILAKPSYVSTTVPQEFATATRPCPAELGFSWSLDEQDPGYSPSGDLWDEGLNETTFGVNDFCTRDNIGICYSQRTERVLPGIVIDSQDPSFSTRPICTPPNGENGWHVGEPYCKVQSVDLFKTCARSFPLGEANCFDTRRRAQASLLDTVRWQEENPLAPSLAKDKLEEGIVRDGVITTILGLHDERPNVNVFATDRAGNTSNVSYSEFVKIDTKKPSALEIIDGPSETEPSGYFGKYSDNPLPPDETNDSSSGASQNPENDDCVLCWTVEGLEIADGTNPSPEDISSGNIPFDFDHPAKLQCQLLYSDTGRSPSNSLADWERAPWPSDGAWSAWQRPSWSPLGAFWSGNDNYQGAGNTIYQSSGANSSQIVADTGWDCLKSDPRGLETEATETVAPFTMAGRVNGHYLFRVRQKDRAGNIGPWKGRPMLYDTADPETGALSGARVYDIVDAQTGSNAENQSTTKQWLFDWGWDLLQRGEKASVYCFIRNTDSREIVRRSGWGCGSSGASGPFKSVETPMPWPGVEGEGAGTLAGLPDGNYEVGFIQRDKLGHTSSFDSAPTLSFTKNGNTIGAVASPRIELETTLDSQSVTSRRTSATLKVRTPLTTDSLGNSVPMTLLPGQAFFPMDGWIAHYTPQDLYSYCQKMTDNYSEYSAEDWSGQVKEIVTEDSVPNCPDEVSGYSGEPYQNEEGVQVPTEVRYSGGLTLDEDLSTINARQGTFILDIFWLQPTAQGTPEADILGGLDD